MELKDYIIVVNLLTEKHSCKEPDRIEIIKEALIEIDKVQFQPISTIVQEVIDLVKKNHANKYDSDIFHKCKILSLNDEDTIKLVAKINYHLYPHPSDNNKIKSKNNFINENQIKTTIGIPILELISRETNEEFKKWGLSDLRLNTEHLTVVKVKNGGGGFLDLHISSDVPWLSVSKKHIDQNDLAYDLKIKVKTNTESFKIGSYKHGRLTFSYNDDKSVVHIPISAKIEGYERTIKKKSIWTVFFALILAYFVHNILWRLFASITPPSIIYGVNQLLTFFLYIIGISLTYRIAKEYFTKYPTSKIAVVLLPILMLVTTFFINVGIEKWIDTKVNVETYDEIDKTGYIKVKKSVNVRSIDSPDANIITKLRKNEKVKVIGQMTISKWYYINFGKNYEQSGYIAPEFIKIDSVSIK